MTCIVIDDEPGAHGVLLNYISRIPELYFAGSFYNAVDASKYLSTHAVDVVFLDINMPKMDGFAMLRILIKKPLIIITTAHTNFAVESYEHDAVDYLHKPISFERFLLSIEKVKRRTIYTDQQLPSPFIDVKIDGITHKLNVHDIWYTESVRNYVRIKYNGKRLLIHITTKELEEKLPSHLFIRIHKSFIVNVHHIDTMDEETITVKNDVLPIGRTYKKYVRDRFNTGK